ncbi:MAG: nucleoside-diphosphate kinase [Erysipelotrichaceae bacterium]
MYKTFIMIKPGSAKDAHRVEAIFKIFKEHNLKVKHIKRVVVSKDLILAHYDEVIEAHQEKDVFSNRILREFVGSEVVIATVTGKGEVVAKVRKLVGVTQPLYADPKSIRGRFGNQDTYEASNAEDRLVQNVIHASDSPMSARREIALWYR